MSAVIERPTAEVATPGVYDLPAQRYHADPVPVGSLSVSGARKLLPPSCPARFRYDADHPEPPSSTFDLGHAAHTLMLGVGPQTVIVDAGDWRTKAAREQRDQAHAAGQVPLLTADYAEVSAMAAALRQHPITGVLFQPGAGVVEQSLFWTDQATGVWRRARPDWISDRDSGRLIVVDYKTTRSASPETLGRAVADYGYHQQAAWYLDGVQAVGLADDSAAFVFVFQEKTPPYIVTVAELDGPALRIGRDLNRRALEIYRDCVQAGVWPGYSRYVELVGLPAWAVRRHSEDNIW